MRPPSPPSSGQGLCEDGSAFLHTHGAWTGREHPAGEALSATSSISASPRRWKTPWTSLRKARKPT
ncbi:MAG: hypothetical protein MZV64_31725 [Ignavibacteriales bacterium]|nr:hypothetical protein [Ignavibacteriales bacterium]